MGTPFPPDRIAMCLAVQLVQQGTKIAHLMMTSSLGSASLRFYHDTSREVDSARSIYLAASEQVRVWRRSLSRIALCCGALSFKFDALGVCNHRHESCCNRVHYRIFVLFTYFCRLACCYSLYLLGVTSLVRLNLSFGILWELLHTVIILEKIWRSHSDTPLFSKT